MVKVNGVNGQPLDRVKHTSLLNEGSQVFTPKHQRRNVPERTTSVPRALRHSVEHRTCTHPLACTQPQSLASFPSPEQSCLQRRRLSYTRCAQVPQHLIPYPLRRCYRLRRGILHTLWRSSPRHRQQAHRLVEPRAKEWRQPERPVPSLALEVEVVVGGAVFLFFEFVCRCRAVAAAADAAALTRLHEPSSLSTLIHRIIFLCENEPKVSGRREQDSPKTPNFLLREHTLTTTTFQTKNIRCDMPAW